MYVTPGAQGDPATLFWIDGKRYYSSALKPIATPAPVPSTTRGLRRPGPERRRGRGIASRVGAGQRGVQRSAVGRAPRGRTMTQPHPAA